MNPTLPPPGWAVDPLLQAIADRCTAWLQGRDLGVEDICLGHPVSWAIVRDGQGRRGLGAALTPIGESNDRDGLFAGLSQDWRDWPLSALPARLLARHPLERCIALAAINAVSQYRLGWENLAPVEPGERGEREAGQGGGRASVVRWVAAQTPQRLVMIGNMQPLVAGLREFGIVPMVFERHASNRCGALNDAQEWAWLPHADGLIATGATLVNHTLAPLVAWTGAARFRILVGFSAQTHPAFLAGLGLTHVFSVHVDDVDGIRRRLQLGHWNAMFESETPYLARLADKTPGLL
ncbi:Rossmann-like domain-containing protein [Candidatus Symbiobacter mobilis]|uniref:Heavy-metal chelation domain-containing protein n=1 Tax=Candidatus Symbiobacter mobilis CR TaxID=946483 RepID=U5N999_9BURK|nr:DUF364 domain-containing protein [Candidatus Symbiobacter mobilis]AGX87972.1 hypothetical protein Cenrod_1893 [Candidatus Symbiobacter mobilis CR]